MKIEYTKTGRVLLALSNILAALLFSAVASYLWLFLVTTSVIWHDLANSLHVYADAFTSPTIRETMFYSMVRSVSLLSVAWVFMGHLYDINHLKAFLCRGFRVKDGTVGW